MSARMQVGPITLIANAALAPYLRVKLSAGKTVVAEALDEELGVNDTRVLTADAASAVTPLNLGGSIRMVAGAAITQFASIYGAAGGKVSSTVNANFIGTALQAASGDGAHVEVLPHVKISGPGDLAGDVIVDDDFTEDWPAAGTALPLGSSNFLKTETLGLGVIDSVEANGVKKFVFDAVAEAATAALHMPNTPFDIDQAPIFECRLAIFDIGDDAALDINFGLASATHATDFDEIDTFAAFHLDGNSLSAFCQSDDGTTDTAPVDTTIDLVDDTYATFRIDVTDKTNVKFYINGPRVLAGTTFDISAFTGLLTPIVHVEKSSNDTTADVRVDRIRCQAGRN